MTAEEERSTVKLDDETRDKLRDYKEKNDQTYSEAIDEILDNVQDNNGEDKFEEVTTRTREYRGYQIRTKVGRETGSGAGKKLVKVSIGKRKGTTITFGKLKEYNRTTEDDLEPEIVDLIELAKNWIDNREEDTEEVKDSLASALEKSVPEPEQ